MRKLILLLSVCMMVSLTACGNKNNNQVSSSGNAKANVTESENTKLNDSKKTLKNDASSKEKEDEKKETTTKAAAKETQTESTKPVETTTAKVETATVAQVQTQAATPAPTEAATQAATQVSTPVPTQAATPAPTKETTQTPTQSVTQAPAKSTKVQAVSYDPNEVVRLAIKKCQAGGMITTEQNLDNLLKQGKITKEEYDEYYPMDGMEGSYFSMFMNVDLNKAADIVGNVYGSVDAIATEIAGMLLLENTDVFNITYAGTYKDGGETYYEFRCHR